MSLQYNPTLISIMQAFQKQGLASNSYYSREQLYAALDRMCGREYDRAVSEQLFEQCQVNFKQQIMLEEFSQVVIEADKILKRKISQTNEQIQDFAQQKEETQQQHNDTKYNQSMNLQGVEKDSLLSILLHQASNIRGQDFSMSFVAITVGKYQHTSNGSQGGDKANPIYNQKFQFNIETGQEEADFKLFVLNRANQQVLVGTAQIDLGELHDQKIHEIMLNLTDQQGHQSGTVLKIDVQWLYNKVLQIFFNQKQKFYSEQMQGYQEGIDQLYVDLDDFKRDLATIQEPFLQLNSLQSQKFTPSQSTTPFQANQSSRQKPLTILDVAPQQQVSRQEGVPSEELHMGFYLILLMGVFTLFESFARPAFVDALLFLLLLIIIILDHFQPEHIRVVGVITIICIFYDIIWLVYYKSSWDSTTDTKDPDWGIPGQSVMRVTIVFVVFNLILKTILCYFLYQFYKESQRGQIFTFEIYQFKFTVGNNQNMNIFRMKN